jgi:hypothetical protein
MIHLTHRVSPVAAQPSIGSLLKSVRHCKLKRVSMAAKGEDPVPQDGPSVVVRKGSVRPRGAAATPAFPQPHGRRHPS